MAQAYPYELRDRAEALYVVKGLTMDQVAGALDVAINTVRAWAKKGEWKGKRKARASLKRNLQTLREKLIEKAVVSLDSQDVYAVAKLERALRGGVPESVDETPKEAGKRGRGLSDETVDDIRRRLLGVKG